MVHGRQPWPVSHVATSVASTPSALHRGQRNVGVISHRAAMTAVAPAAAPIRSTA